MQGLTLRQQRGLHEQNGFDDPQEAWPVSEQLAHAHRKPGAPHAPDLQPEAA